MEKSDYNYARDGFIYLLSYATLLISSVATNFLLKGLIDQYIPDVLDKSRYFIGGNSLIGFLAAVVVAFPVFWYLNWVANRMLKTGKMMYSTGVRRWLLYITLVVVILIIIWQLIQLFIVYLGGQLILRFVLHTLITLLIAFLILGYQWWHLKLGSGEGKSYATAIFKIFEYFVLLIVLVSIVGAFFVIDSPSVQRDKKIDRTRVERLLAIHNSIQVFYGDKEWGNQRLPASLQELVDDPLVFIREGGLSDLETGKQFGYNILDDSRYELCATFVTENKDEEKIAVPRLREPMGEGQLFEGNKGFSHPAGEHCFELAVRT